MNTFTTWLKNEIDRRGWSFRDAAEKTELSKDTIANLIKGKTPPTLYSCRALAKGLDIPVETIMNIAEVFEDKSHPPDLPPEVKALFDDMTPDQQQSALTVLRALKETFDKGKGYKPKP